MRQPPNPRIAANVRAELARADKTARDMAEHLTRSPNTVTRRLRGESAFTGDELERIAAWLDVPITALLGETAAAS